VTKRFTYYLNRLNQVFFQMEAVLLFFVSSSSGQDMVFHGEHKKIIFTENLHCHSRLNWKCNLCLMPPKKDAHNTL